MKILTGKEPRISETMDITKRGLMLSPSQTAIGPKICIKLIFFSGKELMLLIQQQYRKREKPGQPRQQERREKRDDIITVGHCIVY